jgi:hypothetical protein
MPTSAAMRWIGVNSASFGCMIASGSVSRDLGVGVARNAKRPRLRERQAQFQLSVFTLSQGSPGQQVAQL